MKLTEVEKTYALKVGKDDKKGLVIVEIINDETITADELRAFLDDRKVFRGRGLGAPTPPLEGKPKAPYKQVRDTPHHDEKLSMHHTYESLNKHGTCHWTVVGKDLEEVGFKATTAEANLCRMHHTGHSIRVDRGTYAVGKAPPEELPRY